MNFLDPVQFFQFLKNVAMATNFVAKLWQKYLPHCTYCSGIPKWNGILLPSVRINSANDTSILCENFVKFGPVTPELTGICVNVRYDMAKKLTHLVEYLRIYWTDFHNLFTI